MPTEPTPGVQHSPKDIVRIEISVNDERFIHEVKTSLFLDGISVHRRGDRTYWTMDIVRLEMRAEATRDFLTNTLHMMPIDDKLAIIAPVLEELEGHPGLRRTN